MLTTLIIPIDLAHTDQMAKAVTVAANLTTLYDATATWSASPCPAPSNSPQEVQTSPKTHQFLVLVIGHPMGNVPTCREMQLRPLSLL